MGEKGTKFNDKKFRGKGAIRWDKAPHYTGSYSLENMSDAVSWKRISKDFTAADGYSLWGSNGVVLDDIIQG